MTPHPAVPDAVPPGTVLAPMPRESNSAGITLLLVAAALLLAATVGSFIYVHRDKTSTSATVRAVGGQSGGGNRGGGGPTGASGAGDPSASATPPALDGLAVESTMDAYMNAMQNHDLTAARSVVCPKFRDSYKCTYSPKGYAYGEWSGEFKVQVPGTNYVNVVTTQDLLDVRGGAKKAA